MRKLFVILAAFAATISAKADEGMWTLYNLPNAVYEQMKGYGFALPYSSLYQSDDAIKNSVVNFSGYCSGVVVSPDGLVFTNHHCGFEAIRSHSTVEHDYMLNGFFAKTYADELPNKGMFVRFMVDQRDITPLLEKRGIRTMTAKEQAKLLDEVENEMLKEVHAKDANLELEIKPFYEGNKYYATTYQEFRDLRLVFTIPKSMGKFGVRPTTGCGHDRHATFQCSESMPTRRPTALLTTPRTTCHTAPSTGRPFRSTATRRETSP